MKPLVELEFLTAGTIYDPVTPIPVGAAREIAFGGPATIAFENVRLGGGPSVEEVALMFGVKIEPDPNAAMIARDEPTGWCADHTPGETWGFRIDNRPFKWLGGEIVKSTAKPAITGLTTVHDGKVNGLGFCSDLGHE